MGGHASVCRLLIDEKADVNAMEERCSQPLSFLY
jgi:hypothetical protein